jgi:hypothetical protein
MLSLKNILAYLGMHIIVLLGRVCIRYINSGGSSFWVFYNGMDYSERKKVFNPFFYKIDLEELVEYREWAKWINNIQLVLLIFDIFLVTGGIKLIQTYELVSEW